MLPKAVVGPRAGFGGGLTCQLGAGVHRLMLPRCCVQKGVRRHHSSGRQPPRHPARNPASAPPPRPRPPRRRQDSRGNPLPSEKRRKWCDVPSHVCDAAYRPGLVYTFKFWQHYADFGDYRLSVVGALPDQAWGVAVWGFGVWGFWRHYADFGGYRLSVVGGPCSVWGWGLGVGAWGLGGFGFGGVRASLHFHQSPPTTIALW